ncbi:uncharacterized protein LOC117640808 [Thrips palmi]|uniref:Uncharacterized protein LOC117640800 n=1 Tax=Thrips palmi TaxID=161013 RepID=A0A6P8YBI1_THRPL|nr:uncharacterized protein LOC117640800 [Thrips palmi]XP_034233582.1 uncharacterized protein LOC117640800 [Thrips palmi]XP_034233596.1 uncharacterized protein LOC117640808 [Thrips palmi]
MMEDNDNDDGLVAGEGFFLGQEFASYNEFEDRRLAFQENTYCLFVMRRSERSQNNILKFNKMQFECKQAMSTRPARGKKPHHESYKIGCEARIHVAATTAGRLKVTAFHDVHNHPCNETTYFGYPEVQRMF